MNRFTIFRNNLNADFTWDVETKGSPHPPCSHKTVQDAIDCIVESNGHRQFYLEVKL